MKRIKTDDTSYKTFQDILTGYRLSQVMVTAFKAGVFDVLEQSGTPGEDICRRSGWEDKAGGRFLETLCSVGFLEKKDGLYFPSPFSQKFMMGNSDGFQGTSLQFEERLVDSWGLLDQTLVDGNRIYGSNTKSDEEYKKALHVYLGAMNDAAHIRASELWDRVNISEKTGVLLDAGAGSGAFLIEFLKKYPGWKGVFCDLKDVIHKARSNPEIMALDDRIEFIECNLLEDTSLSSLFKNRKADYVLFSNLVHCQAEKETMHIFCEALATLSDAGVVLVHDFFSDCGWRGAMYDLHMMLNTFNGRTYKTKEITGMLEHFGLLTHETLQLPSGSTLMVAAKKRCQEPDL